MRRLFNLMSICSTLLLFTLSTLCLPAMAVETPPSFLFQFGTQGNGEGQFQYPFDQANNHSGNIYVADTSNHRIQKFKSDGTFIGKWGSFGTGNGQFNQPYSVAVDPSGFVYVVDKQNNRIQKFDGNGYFIKKWGTQSYGPIPTAANGTFRLPCGIAIDPSNNIYVADSGNCRIQKFTSDGAFLGKWGSQGPGDGQFQLPWDVATDQSGNVYVADTNNNRMQKFSSIGAFLGKWGSYGAGNGQFSYPNGVAVDPSGKCYVSDVNHSRIEVFNSNGDFLLTFGTWGSEPGNFLWPRGLSWDSNNRLYVCDYGNHRVQVFGESNQAPVADMGGDQDVFAVTALFNATVVFDGSASYDPDGDTPLDYSWDFGDNTPIVSGTDKVTVTHTYNGLARYNGKLTVSDPKGATGVDTFEVSVGLKAVCPSGDPTKILIPKPQASGELPPGLDVETKLIYLTPEEFAQYHAVSQGISPKTGRGFEVYQK